MSVVIKISITVLLLFWTNVVALTLKENIQYGRKFCQHEIDKTRCKINCYHINFNSNKNVKHLTRSIQKVEQVSAVYEVIL